MTARVEDAPPGATAPRGASGSARISVGLDTKTESAAKLSAQIKRGVERNARERKYSFRDQMARLLPEERVAFCGRFRVQHGEVRASNVPVVRFREEYTDSKGKKQTRPTDRCEYAGLAVCGSVWLCPVCSSKIANRRAAEVRTLLEHHLSENKTALFITRTLPHQYGDSIFVLLAQLTAAMRKAKGSGTVRRLIKARGDAGSIRALEVTHGKNGWHPHVHEMLLLDGDITADQLHTLKEALWAAWKSALDSVSAPGASQDAFKVDIITTPDVGDYALKMASWGPADELARWHIKESKGGASPWQLIERSINGDKQASALLLEYAEAFKGRAALYWSKEARNRLEKLTMPVTDTEILAEDTPEVEFDSQGNPVVQAEGVTKSGKPFDTLGVILFSDWLLVLKHHAQARVLTIAETEGWQGVESFLASLRANEKKKHRA